MDSRVLARLNLTSVAKLSKPPKLVLKTRSLSVTDEIRTRVRERLVRVVNAGIEDWDLT